MSVILQPEQLHNTVNQLQIALNYPMVETRKGGYAKKRGHPVDVEGETRTFSLGVTIALEYSFWLIHAVNKHEGCCIPAFS